MTTTPTLTDRYVHAMTRGVPDAQRAEVAAELRERIADAVDARMATGEPAHDAERAVLGELGDPDRLAADYLGRPLQLIGPKYYLTWWRLIKLLLAIVPASVAGAVLIATAIDGRGIGEIIGGAVSVTLTTTLHLIFWTTLAFAIIERAAAAGARAGHTPMRGALDEPWTVDRLPDLDPSGQTSRASAIAEAVFGALFVAFLIAQQFNPLLHADDGTPIPLIDPVLWSWFLPWLIVVVAIDIALTIAIVLHGRTSWWSAVGSALTTIAISVPALWLWSTGALLNPDFLAHVPVGEGTDWRPITGIVVGIVWAGVVVWDVIDGFRKAWRARSAAADS